MEITMNKFKEKAKAFFDKEGAKLSGTGFFALTLALIIVLNIFLFVLVEAFGWYIYEEKGEDLSLSGNTDSMFEEAKNEGKKIKITFCLDRDSLEKHETGSFVHQTALNFLERYPTLVELEYVNIMTRRDSKNRLVENFNDRYLKDMRGNETYVRKTSVMFECGDNWRILTDPYTSAGFSDFFTLDSSNYISSYNGEEVMAAMMAWVLRDEHKTVYFTQYHGEEVDIAFSNLLVCAGYYIDVVDLKNEDVPADASMLVISNPKTDFEMGYEGSGIVTEIESEIERMRNYLSAGGNLYVTLDPYVKELSVLESFIAEYGIEFSTTEYENGRVARNIVKDTQNAITLDGFTLVSEFSESELAKKISDKIKQYGDGGVIMREVSALELSGSAKPLLVSSSSSVLSADGKTVNSDGAYTLAAYSETALENGAFAKLFVVPSVYLAVSDTLISREYSNKDFLYALFDGYFGGGIAPLGCRAVLYNNETLENLTMRNARIYTALIMIIPVAVAITGSVVLTKRKNR